MGFSRIPAVARDATATDLTMSSGQNPKGKTSGHPELYEVIVSRGSSYGVCDTRIVAGALPRYFRVSTAGLRTCSATPRSETAYDDLLRDCNVIVTTGNDYGALGALL